MFEEEASAEHKLTLYRALTLVSVGNERYGNNQHFHAEPAAVKELVDTRQIEAVDAP